MVAAIEIRRYAGAADLPRIERLVSAAVRECYGNLLDDYHFNTDENWPASWVAEAGGEVVGVLLTGNAWLDDLWIARTHRRRGIGTRLLEIAEGEIAGRGYTCARLRVVAANLSAQQFYAKHGWREDRRYSHEAHGFSMVEMIKALAPPPDPKS